MYMNRGFEKTRFRQRQAHIQQRVDAGGVCLFHFSFFVLFFLQQRQARVQQREGLQSFFFSSASYV